MYEGKDRGERRPHFGGFEKPVKVGETVSLQIVGKGKDGDGIGKVNGYVIFVKGDTEVDKTYDVKILTVGRKFATGEVVSTA